MKEGMHVTRTMFHLPQPTCVLWPCILHTKLPLVWKPQSITYTISVTKTKYILWFIQIYHKEGYVLCKISSFRHEVHENCALLGYYAVSSGNFSPTFRDNPISPILKNHIVVIGGKVFWLTLRVWTVHITHVCAQTDILFIIEFLFLIKYFLETKQHFSHASYGISSSGLLSVH